jgi:hypothetical protein
VFQLFPFVFLEYGNQLFRPDMFGNGKLGLSGFFEVSFKVVGAHYTECTAWSDPAAIYVFVTELSPDATTLRIYPNPASETVNIESITIKQIIIVNNLGQVVYDSPFNNDYVQINTSNLRKGMYVIFIRTAGTTFTEKLIIK